MHQPQARIDVKLTLCNTTFFFKENLLPIFYLISYILTQAIRDNAILVDSYTFTRLFFATNLQGQGIKAIKVYQKPKQLKQPVFPRLVQPLGYQVKSKIELMLYLVYAFYINQLRRKTSFEDKLTSYCFRQGTANTINGR